MVIHCGVKGYVRMRIIYGYIGFVDRVLEIFKEFGGVMCIFKRLGIFKGIWNFSSIFGVLMVLKGST